MRNPLLLSVGLAAITAAVIGLAAPARAADCLPGQDLDAPCPASQPPCPEPAAPCAI